MKYMIIEGGETKDLEYSVKLAIEDGFEPLGGVSVVVKDTGFAGCDYSFNYVQAMVKK